LLVLATPRILVVLRRINRMRMRANKVDSYYSHFQ